MSSRFRDCITNRYLRKCLIDSNKVRREIAEAKNDLDSAKISLKETAYKWAIIQGYYAIFSKIYRKIRLCECTYSRDDNSARI